jgi:hypothetical protein
MKHTFFSLCVVICSQYLDNRLKNIEQILLQTVTKRSRPLMMRITDPVDK